MVGPDLAEQVQARRGLSLVVGRQAESDLVLVPRSRPQGRAPARLGPGWGVEVERAEVGGGGSGRAGSERAVSRRFQAWNEEQEAPSLLPRGPPWSHPPNLVGSQSSIDG